MATGDLDDLPHEHWLLPFFAEDEFRVLMIDIILGSAGLFQVGVLA